MTGTARAKYPFIVNGHNRDLLQCRCWKHCGYGCYCGKCRIGNVCYKCSRRSYGKPNYPKTQGDKVGKEDTGEKDELYDIDDDDMKEFEEEYGEGGSDADSKMTSTSGGPGVKKPEEEDDGDDGPDTKKPANDGKTAQTLRRKMMSTGRG
jgi:hypothetical protein